MIDSAPLTRPFCSASDMATSAVLAGETIVVVLIAVLGLVLRLLGVVDSLV